MKSTVTLLMGYWLSAVLMNKSTISALSTRCTNISKTFSNVDCRDMMAYKHSKDNEKCVDEIIKSKSKRNEKKYQLFQKLIYQYCKDASGGYIVCCKCLPKAFEDHWNEHFCLEVNNFRAQELKDCLWKHPNFRFGWSHNIIFNNYHEAVDFSVKIYPKCHRELTDALLTSGSKFAFPIKLNLQEDVFDTYMNVYLSLYLDALRQGVNYEHYVGCEDIVESEILKTFKKLSDVKIKPVPDKIKQAYLNLRGSMCAKSNDSKTCETCFNKADNKFLFHLYNLDHKVSSVLEDFKEISDNLTKCIQDNFDSRYSYLQYAIDDYKKTWTADFYECPNSWSEVYNATFGTNVQNMRIYTKNEPIVKIVAANYFAFRIYKNLIKSDHKKMCDEVIDSGIMCTAVKTIQATSNIDSEAEQTQQLAYNLQLCGI